MGFKMLGEKGHTRKESRRYDNIGSHLKDSVIGDPIDNAAKNNAGE